MSWLLLWLISFVCFKLLPLLIRLTIQEGYINKQCNDILNSWTDSLEQAIIHVVTIMCVFIYFLQRWKSIKVQRTQPSNALSTISILPRKKRLCLQCMYLNNVLSFNVFDLFWFVSLNHHFRCLLKQIIFFAFLLFKTSPTFLFCFHNLLINDAATSETIHI